MNYLAHYYFNTENLPGPLSADFHFGVALPDLLSAYDRNYRLTRIRVAGLAEAEPVPGLWRGVSNHLYLDACFHQSRFFRQTYEALRRILMDRLPARLSMRRFFLAHLFSEMLLDHCLIRQQPGLVDDFYDSLGQCETGRAFEAVGVFFGERMDLVVPHFHRFMAVRFLAKYATLEGLCGPVDRMLTRTHQTPFGESDRPLLLAVLSEARRTVSDQLPAARDEMKAFYARSPGQFSGP